MFVKISVKTQELSSNFDLVYQDDENKFVESSHTSIDLIKYCAGFCYLKSCPTTVSLYNLI